MYLCLAYDMLVSSSYTMRGRPFVVVGLGVTSMSLLATILDLSVACSLSTHVYHLTSSMLSPDHLTCHYLARPSCYVMTYPDLLSIHCYACYLIYITIYHAISWHQAWYTDSYNYHDKGNVVPDYCYVLITVMYSCYDIAHSRNLIIMFISYKKDNLYGEWEEVMDAGMIPCL